VLPARASLPEGDKMQQPNLWLLGTVPPLKDEVTQVLLVKPDLPRCWDPAPSLSQGFTPRLASRHTALLILGGPRLLPVGKLEQTGLGGVDGLCQAERCMRKQNMLCVYGWVTAHLLIYGRGGKRKLKFSGQIHGAAFEAVWSGEEAET